ncbi:ABC transporter substrate-binding protein [uncultured Roseobacter sp.]|uniref:ABC transporter substrate-binding protein n=1 Tax=uncultured Roseobacter sp. TaxID=114847 RepID=UPI002639E98B|nr:ABC transporter substrate-binding protein [uncultured Roseobacter sp.]
MTRALRPIDRRALFASGAAAALLAATGVSAGPSPVRGGRLRMALSGASRSDAFDVRFSQGLFMQVAMAGMVFDTLTEVGADGTLRGELAARWQGSADARVWHIDLRPDVTFHNGAPFTAADVLASFALHRDTILSDVADVDAVTADQIRITLTGPDPDFPYRLSAPHLVIYPAKHMAEAMSGGIGTGLYQVHKFLPGRQLIGQRVDQHYKDGEAGWFDRVELVSVPAEMVRAEALRDGYVDAVDLTEADLLEGLAHVALLPDSKQITSAATVNLHMPQMVGTRAPLDNLRAAERWWMG